MEFLTTLLQSLAGGMFTQLGINITGWMAGKIKEAARDKKSSEIRNVLQELGTTSSSQVRSMVHEVLGKEKKVPKAQQEAVADLLVNLARGASLLTSQGRPRSSYLRCEGLIEQLLGNLETVRKAGEPVGVGHDWTLKRFLGKGTFGEVWLAVNPHAPKLPPRAYKFFTHEGAPQWLKNEKDTLLAVQYKLGKQPQVVQLLDVAIEGHKYPFLALEYVGGGSLEDWILEDKDVRSPLRKHDIIRGMVLALAKAHQQGIYHRDLKPANILLTEPPDVQAKIADFGLGKVKESAGGSVALSQAFLQVGTPMYWPPELQEPFASARDPDQDAKSDVFAIGVIWYQLLVERLERPSYDFAAELRECGQDTHTIQLISRCLAHPKRRFKDASELADEIESADLPRWDPVPEGLYDVQALVREYITSVPK